MECPYGCGLKVKAGRWAKGAMATHVRFKHKKGKWKKDARFDSKQRHETGRKTPGKVYKPRQKK